VDPFTAIITGGLAVFVVALLTPDDDSFTIGGLALVGTSALRSLALAWSAGAALLGLLEVAAAGSVVVVGPSLTGLAVAILALASKDPGTSFAALSAGGVAGIASPSLRGWLSGTSSPTRLVTATRGSLAVLGAGLLAIAVVAWGASPIGPLGGGGFGVTPGPDRLALGVGLLAMVTAVALRAGLIPLHLWAARFMEGVTPLAVPAAFAWGTAAFVLVAIDWSQVAVSDASAGGLEHVLVVAIALVSVVLGGIAAMVHDDVEHVLGYSIVQDAAIAMLAFASLGTDVAAAARSWLIASAAVKTAFAAWAAVVRATFGGHRLADLGGWARRAPALGAAFLVILVAAVGLPGTALFDARSTLVFGAVSGPLGLIVLVLALTPLGFLGRIAAAGIARMSPAVASAPPGRLTWRAVRAAGWSGSGMARVVRAVPSEVRANRVPLMALAVLALSIVGLLISIAGPGT
jgi:formate hydrogenlyase subunit 3/multisubunit Na+/H+ antiporter MnhD subunit